MLASVTVRATTLQLVPRPVAASVDELLAGGQRLGPLEHTDGKSGAPFERVLIDGAPHVLKFVHIDDDWTMRFFHETTCIPLEVWRLGHMDVLPGRIDHTVVGTAGGYGRDGLGAVLLMRDVGSELIPEGDAPVSLEDHLQLLDDLAALAACTWGWRGDPALLPYGNRWLPFRDDDIEAEEARGFPDVVPRIARDGWDRFREKASADVRDLVLELRRDVTPLVDALVATPSAFLHGDWKMGNLGLGRDGRTILIDWSYCGAGPVCHELGWYLALNRARLPHSKDEAIAAMRSSLERHGVTTDGWWQTQLDLCLLGTLVQFGWEKALGDEHELGWWCDRAREGASRL
jgi:hypothetical protein